MFKASTLFVLMALLSFSKSDFQHPDLKPLEGLTLENRWTLLLDHWFLPKPEPSPFVLVKDGKSQEFPAATKYSKVSQPRLSPDARSIAYVGLYDQSSQLAVIDTATGKTTFLDVPGKDNEVATWAPDSSEVVIFNSESQEFRFINLDHGTVGRQIHVPGIWPTLSPNMKQAIIEERSGALAEKPWVKLFLFDVVTGAKRYLDDGQDAAWSPDGDLIAYLDPKGKRCIIVSLSGRTHKFSFRTSGLLDSPSESPLIFSPDGRFLLFHREDGPKGYYHNPYAYDLQRKQRKFLGAFGLLEIVDMK